MYWFETADTIVEGVGFNYFDLTHLFWLGALIVFTILMSIQYRRSNEKQRFKMRQGIALAIILDELFKIFVLCFGGNYGVEYLPFHLCSINIFIIAYHVYKPSLMLDNFLYAVCIPGALAAILAPTWIELPICSFMHLHSFTIHILLVAYPVMLVAGGDIKPDIKEFPKCILFTFLLAIPIYMVNLLCDTNFMFLMYAEPGNPLYYFGEWFGWHLLGVPVIEGIVVAILYLPYYGFKARKKRVNEIRN